MESDPFRFKREVKKDTSEFSMAIGGRVFCLVVQSTEGSINLASRMSAGAGAKNPPDHFLSDWVCVPTDRILTW
jgi:hypothetical protein